MATGIKLFAEPQKIYTGSMESLFLRESLVETDYPLIIEQGAFLVAGNVPKVALQINVMASLYGQYEEYAISAEKRAKYANLIDCVWFRESSRGQKMVGDHGLAKGHFQIHTDKHPVSYECAMDYFCSSAYFVQQVEAGRGWLWSTYNKCKSK